MKRIVFALIGVLFLLTNIYAQEETWTQGMTAAEWRSAGNQAISDIKDSIEQHFIYMTDKIGSEMITQDRVNRTLPDTIYMADYSNGEDRIGYYSETGSTVYYPDTTGGVGIPSYLHSITDTLKLGYSTRVVSFDRKEIYMSTIDSIECNIRNFNYNTSIIDEFYNKRKVFHRYDDISIAPDDNDTVRMSSAIGTAVYLRAFTGGGSNNRIDIEEMNGMLVSCHVDDELAVDSLIVLKLYSDDNGIDPDSINAYYGIYHQGNAPIYGKDRTYFLYSEYGDNYLNGDLHVTSDITVDSSIIFGQVASLTSATKGQIYYDSDDDILRMYNGVDYDSLNVVGSTGGSGTVASVSAGDGMDFTTITTTGSVTMGTPGQLTPSTTNTVTTTSHTHDVRTALAITESSDSLVTADLVHDYALASDSAVQVALGWGIDSTMNAAQDTMTLFVDSTEVASQYDLTQVGGTVATFTNGTDNYIVTATATDGINGESNLMFDGTDLSFGSAVIQEAEMEIIDGATITTAELNAINGRADSIANALKDTTDIELIAYMLNDTVVHHAFYESTTFSASHIYGSFYNNGSDTLVITELAVSCLGTTVDFTVDVQWHATLGSGSSVHLNTTPLSISVEDGTITSDVAFDNDQIPPGVQVWLTTPTSTTPATTLSVTLLGTKLNRSY